MPSKDITFTRKQLYDEIWATPATKVAQKYGIPYAQFRKKLMAANIPAPPSGYWTKINFGKPVEKIALSGDPNEVISLSFENEDYGTDETGLLKIASQIRLPGKNKRLNPAIIAHRELVLDWKKEKEKIYLSSRARNRPQPPYLALGISEKTISLACRIIDALISAAEPLGWQLTQDLAFVIGGETVRIHFSESQAQSPHALTKQEQIQLQDYEKRIKNNSYAAKPQIPKYDYTYTGVLRCTINNRKTIRPKKDVALEERLGELLLGLAAVAEQERQDRIARELAEQKRREEAAQREALRKRREEEFSKTDLLVKEANDYETAVKIRAYIAAYRTNHPDDANEEWIAWAAAKADWYDPTIHLEDPLLGKRKPGEDLNEMKSFGYRYW